MSVHTKKVWRRLNGALLYIYIIVNSLANKGITDLRCFYRIIIAGGIVCLSVHPFVPFLPVLYMGLTSHFILGWLLQWHKLVFCSYLTEPRTIVRLCVTECKEEGRWGINKCLEANNLFDVTTEKLHLYCHKLGQSMWQEEKPNLLCRKPCLNNSWLSYKGTSVVVS